MSSGLKLIKGAARRKALVYGMRFFGPGEVAEIGDARVMRGDGGCGSVARPARSMVSITPEGMPD